MSHSILDTPDQIEAYRLKVIISGLKLEILGMKHSTNAIFKAAKAITGKKTRKDCLESLQEMVG